MNDNECSGIFMNVQNIRLRIDRRRCIDQSITNFIIKEFFLKNKLFDILLEHTIRNKLSSSDYHFLSIFLQN